MYAYTCMYVSIHYTYTHVKRVCVCMYAYYLNECMYVYKCMCVNMRYLFTHVKNISVCMYAYC